MGNEIIVAKQEYCPNLELEFVKEDNVYRLKWLSHPKLYTGSRLINKLYVNIKELFTDDLVYCSFVDESNALPMTLVEEKVDTVSIVIPNHVLAIAGTKEVSISVKRTILINGVEQRQLITNEVVNFDVEESSVSIDYEQLESDTVEIFQDRINRQAQLITEAVEKLAEILEQFPYLDDLQKVLTELNSNVEFVDKLQTLDSTEHLKISPLSGNGQTELVLIKDALTSGLLADKIIAKFRYQDEETGEEKERISNLNSVFQTAYSNAELYLKLFVALYQVKAGSQIIFDGKIFDVDNNIILKSTDLADSKDVARYEDERFLYLLDEIYTVINQIIADVKAIKLFFDCNEEDLNQLSELVEVLKNNTSGIKSIMEQLASKVNQTNYNADKTALETRITTDTQAVLTEAKKYTDDNTNVISIGSVTSGTVANASIEGTPPNQVLNLVLPKGDIGAVGAKGDRGEKGDSGEPNVLTVGKVVTGATAIAEITGDTPNQVLNLVLPKGDKGDKGAVGAKGDKGETGTKGDKGEANVLTLGTVVGGAVANATITGTSPNQTLNLVLPKGDKGEKGDNGDKGDKGEQGLKGDKGDEGVQGIPGIPFVQGVVYMFARDVNPAAKYGGKWTKLPEGLFIMSAGSTIAINSKGGTATHTLTADEMPSHNHAYKEIPARRGTYSGDDIWIASSYTLTDKEDRYTTYRGGTQPHNNIPPYIALNFWIKEEL